MTKEELLTLLIATLNSVGGEVNITPMDFAMGGRIEAFRTGDGIVTIKRISDDAITLVNPLEQKD